MSDARPRPVLGWQAAYRWRWLLVCSAAVLLVLGLLLSQLLATPRAITDDVVMSDGFDRTVASGWGQSPNGVAWSSVVGGSSTAVSSSEAVVKGLQGGRSFRAYQPSLSVGDVSVRAELTIPDTKDFQYSVEGRKQTNGSSYSARARIDAGGKLHLDVLRTVGTSASTLKELTLATPTTAGGKLTIKLAVTGTDPVLVQGKVYLSSDTEPGWLVTTLDSSSSAVTSAGYTGISVYSGAGNPTVTLSTQSFVVNKVAVQAADSQTEDADVPYVPLKHGADKVGTARYDVPSDALFVSPAGDDSNPGTQAAPFKTLTKALSKNWSGQTIVLRKGVYHEYVLVPPGHAATIQPYPDEEVWFDGTSTVTGWKASGSRWVAGWTAQFDSSPTYTKGQPDGTAAGWQFVNADHPMAARPDQVWLDDVEQEQVGSLSQVGPGKFYVDYDSKALYLGSDPSGTSVRASDLAQAFSLRAPGTVLRGFGVRRYADSVYMQGVINSYYERMTLDNMTVLDAATGGIGLFKSNSVIKDTTVKGSGQLGIQANQADGMVLDDVSVQDSNDQQFNPAPSAGGIKITATRGFTMKDSEILRTTGNGFWSDVSVYQMTLTGNEILNGSRAGIVLEISSLATVANNIIAGNATDGILVSDTDKVSIWNNTIVKNRRAVAFVQDSRRGSNPDTYGHDPRRPNPDPDMPWVIGTSNANDNIYSVAAGSPAIYVVDSYEKAFDAKSRNITSNGNVYAQPAYGTPDDVVIWAKKDANPDKFVLLSDFTGNTGNGRSSYNLLKVAPVNSNFEPTTAVKSKMDSVAQPLPSDVATKVGKPAGTQYLGAWR